MGRGREGQLLLRKCKPGAKRHVRIVELVSGAFSNLPIIEL